nr:uncharacterized protein LOC111517075 [Leptinotarsa decemlineata]
MTLQMSRKLTKVIVNSNNRSWQSKQTIGKYFQRYYTSTEWTNLTERPKNKVTEMPPMDIPVKDLPKPIYSNFKEEDQKTKVTILSNGLTVASEDRFGEFCTVGGETFC